MKIPTGVHGALPREMMGLLIGRSSMSLHGITVIPEVIDSDYIGEIQIMVSPPTKTIQIYKGQKIAQLLMLPCHADVRKVASAAKRQDGGSDSSDYAFWVTQVTQKRPMKTILVNGKKVTGLLDTGADIPCIVGNDWPSAWPTQTTANELVGIGRAPSVTKSSQILPWYVDKDFQGHFQPYVIPSLHFTLWGRDILAQMGVLLYCPEEKVVAQMLQMSYNPFMGLGKDQEGQIESVVPKIKRERQGLRYPNL